MDCDQNEIMVEIEENPLMNIMGGPRRFLVEAIEEQAQVKFFKIN